MSKTIDRALEQLVQSEFNFIPGTTQMEVRNAVIFWTNFRGEANQFGNTARTFNLAVTPEIADELEKQGWRIREAGKKVEDGGNGILYFVNIKVNMQSNYPPDISIFTEFRGKRSRRPLTIDTVGELDRMILETCDCIINGFESKNFPGKITGYLRKLNAIQEPNIEFGGKYDDWMDDERPDTLDEDDR